MAKRTRIPEGAEYRQRWAQLDRPARRRVMRAVNRARALDKRNEAVLAVALARAQQRFWRVAWLLGPALGALLAYDQPVTAIVANAGLAAAVFGVLAVFFRWRARRAEEVNLQVVEGKRRR